VAVESYGRIQLWGDLMRIRRVDVQDAGRYVCSARNQFGEQQAETHLSVTSKLNARIQPQLQVLYLRIFMLTENSLTDFWERTYLNFYAYAEPYLLMTGCYK
jgi:hypothetical protein